MKMKEKGKNRFEIINYLLLIISVFNLATEIIKICIN